MPKSTAELTMQCQQITWFKSLDNPHKGVLWANDNNSVSQRQAQAKESRGMVKGTSDLSYLSPDGTFYALENKIVGTKHDMRTLIDQLMFARQVQMNNGIFLYLFSVEDLQKVIGIKTQDLVRQTEAYAQKILNNKLSYFIF